MDIEVTHYTIKKKKRIFIQSGSFNKNNHPQQTTSDIWAASISGTLCVPRIQTAAMGTKLAVEVGKLDLIYPAIIDSIKSSSNSFSQSDSEKHSDSNYEEEKDDVSPVISTDLPNASKYPLLHFLFFYSGLRKPV
jgi:hypothetical protein